MRPIHRRFTRSPAAFYLIVVACLAGYSLLAFWFPLKPFYNHSPLPDIRSLAPTLQQAYLYALLLLGLYSLYLLAYRLTEKLNRQLSLKIIILTTALFSFPLLFTFPFNATDLYRYFIRGRISSVYSENPYLVPASSLAEDPYLPLAGEWAGETSPYGPLWELTAGAITTVVPDDLFSALLLFKILAITCHIACAAVIWQSLKGISPKKRSSLTLLWAWNPALLLIFAADGHNDSLMLVWLLLGWLLMYRDHVEAGMVVMLVGPLTKPIALLALPFFFVYGWNQLLDLKARGRFLILSGTAGLILIWVAFLPFGTAWELARRLVSEASTGGGFSLLALLILQVRAWGLNARGSSLVRLSTILFAGFALTLLWQTWRGRSSLRAAADVFAGYILQALRFRIWYAVWPFPWLILDQGRGGKASDGRLAAGLAFLLTSQLSVLIYGQLRTEALAGSQLRAHRIGTAITFLLPLLIGFVVTAYNARLRERQTKK